MITGYLIIKNMAGSGRGQSLARTDRKISWLSKIVMPMQIYGGQFFKLYHRIANYALNMEDLLSDNYCKFMK
jgi:hypothetical protein